ncbi:MAG: TSUP family transporter [Arenicella sp.]
MMEAILGIDGIQISLLMLVIFVSGLARGYAGFGLSAVAITAGSIFMEPVKLVPVLYVLEIVASIHMLRSVYRDVDRKLLVYGLIGCAIGMPVGQELLLYLPESSTRIALYGVVVISTLFLHSGITFSLTVNRTLGLGIGLIVGVGSGLATIGGLAAMIILLAINYDVVKARATMVVMFFVLYVYGTIVGSMNGIVTLESLKLSVLFLLPLFAGLVLGQKGFLLTTKEQFLKFLLAFLTSISVVGLGRVWMSTND